MSYVSLYGNQVVFLVWDIMLMLYLTLWYFCGLNSIFFFSMFFYILILVVFLVWLEVGDKVMSALAGEVIVSGMDSHRYRGRRHDTGWG